MPGALLMATKAAARSGVGLLTACGPESVMPSFSAALPEAMWVPMPDTPDGGLALEGRALVLEKLSRATALVAGPGLGTERETQVLLSEILKEFDGHVLVPLFAEGFCQCFVFLFQVFYLILQVAYFNALVLHGCVRFADFFYGTVPAGG